LIALLKRTLDEERLPLAPRLDPLKAILAKLEPPPSARNRYGHCRAVVPRASGAGGGGDNGLLRPFDDGLHAKLGHELL
jgi:hypothetical protein